MNLVSGTAPIRSRGASDPVRRVRPNRYTRVQTRAPAVVNLAGKHADAPRAKKAIWLFPLEQWCASRHPLLVRLCSVAGRGWQTGVVVRAVLTHVVLLRGEGGGGDALGSRLGRMPTNRTLHCAQAWIFVVMSS